MNGLVLAGGKSSRMGIDKALIDYHGLPQYQYLHHLLSNFCEQTFVSYHTELDAPTLLDSPEYAESGPIAGLLTAFDFDETDWLVVAIDYPMISKKELELLIHSESELATVMYHSETNFYEPYLGLYRKKFKSILLENYKKNQLSLQRILQENRIEKAIPENLESLKSINSLEEMRMIKNNLNSI